MAELVRDDVHRVAAERLPIFPAFPEDRLHVAHRRTADEELDVVPRRSGPVHGGHPLPLRIAGVRGIVPPAVAQVDPADERHVLLRPAGVPQHDELLVVRAQHPHPHVQQALAAGRVHLGAEMPVLHR